MASADPTMEPGSLLNSNGEYILQTKDIQSLLKYVWTGVLLASNRAAYQQRVGIKEIKPVISTLVDNLLSNYGAINQHCKKFKDITYPSIVALADSIYDFAQNAGGTNDDSYYTNILIAGKSLYAELAKPMASQNSAKVAECTETVKGLVDAQVEDINRLRDQATATTKALRDFEAECKVDQTNLEATQRQLKDKLQGSGGEIDKLEASLTARRQELADDQAEYVKDVTIAATAPTYSWVTFVGTVIAAVIIGVYSDKAIKMKATIEAVKQLISDNDAQLAADKVLVADMHLIDSDLNSIISLIGPAVTAIEKMVGVWDAIARDLEAISNMVGTRSAKGNAVVQKLSQNIILKKWNALKDAVDQYRKAAYISTPAVTTLTQLSADLTKAAKAA